VSTTEQVPAKWVGQSLRRKEDPRLITGRATYVDDIVLPGMLHAAIVRSPEAHARIVSIDSSAALERTGVRAVFTGEDMHDLLAPLPMAWAPPGVEIKTPERWPLARGRVCHVGDAVAMVVGDDKYVVVDAVQDVLVEYESLPVVVDVEEALKDDTLVHESLGTNTAHEWSMGGGDIDHSCRRRRRDRAPDRQPPYRWGRDRAARLHRRVPRRRTDGLVLDAGAPPGAAVLRRADGHQRGQGACHRARGRRRLRFKAAGQC
jgi:CO/xanthine dehydrogenase Mo-binding subunit